MEDFPYDLEDLKTVKIKRKIESTSLKTLMRDLYMRLKYLTFFQQIPNLEDVDMSFLLDL